MTPFPIFHQSHDTTDGDSGGIELNELNVVNVGVERNFYGREGESELDRLQTEKEAHFARGVATARRNGLIDPELIAEFAANIIFRTRNLRDGFLSTARRILEAGRTLTSQNVEKVITDLMIRKVFDTVAQKRGLEKFEQLPPETQKRMLDGFQPFLAELDTAIQPLTPHLRGTVDSIWDEMNAEVTYGAVRRAHIDSLARTVVPPNAVEYMRSLDWCVTKFAPGTLILGDVGMFAYVPSKGIFEFAVDAPLHDASVLLPISDQCILVGTNKIAPRPSCRLVANQRGFSFSELQLHYQFAKYSERAGSFSVDRITGGFELGRRSEGRAGQDC